MTKRDLEHLLKLNTKAGEHADTIRKTLEDLRQLREAGLEEAGFNISPPFGGNSQLGKSPSARAKQGPSKLKRAFFA